jgi:hypothetical protein
MLEENGAASGWDPYSIAQEAQKLGSFYNSMHFSWHFTLTPTVRPLRKLCHVMSSCINSCLGYHRQEIDVPAYVQAVMISSWARGGWPGTWESTGGIVRRGILRNPLIEGFGAGIQDHC